MIPWYLMAKGKGGGGYKTVSGPIVSISDALAAPLRSLLVNIEPVQEGSGDPSPDNVRPISGWSAVNVWRTGKNLLDPTDYLINADSNYYRDVGYTLVFGSSGASVSGTNPIEIAVTSNWKGATFFSEPLKTGTTYHLRYRISAPTNEDIKRSLYWVDESNTVVVRVGSWSSVDYGSDHVYHAEITPPTDGLRMAFVVTSSTQQTITIYDMGVMIRDWATYEPYTGNQYTIQLGQTVYGGTLDVINGVLTVTHKYYENAGTGNWGEVTSGGARYYIGGVSADAKSDSTNGWSNIGALVSNFQSDGIDVSSNGRINLCGSLHSAFASVEDLKAYLFSNPLQIVYELATPITIPLTATEIATLFGANNIWADTGDVTVEYLSSGGTDPDLMKLAVAFMGRK